VELKNRADYEFAKKKFEELWRNAVDVGEKYIETIHTKTWLRSDISPYELFLKFLYEYFKDELSISEKLELKYVSRDYIHLEYQNQAVLNAKKILGEYGGVFLSDVVGLGKTYMAAKLVTQLDGRTLVIAPPVLLGKDNPGSWCNVFSDFNIHADFVSIGKLDEALREAGKREYKNVIIDEAHRFRTEKSVRYEKLARICRGKRVILVTATPYNNSPEDILSQIKLFQNPRKSTIPGVSDLERFFNKLSRELEKAKKEDDYDLYIKTAKKISKEIREKVLKYIMVRRTRSKIEKYFSQDIEKHGLRFPKIKDPIPFYYQMNKKEEKAFNETINLLTRKFKYARYTPLLYCKGKISQNTEISQRNMGKFMKILLVKRLESSFFAFRQSIDRFIRSYETFIKEFDRGNVYISKKHISKVFELLENGDDEAVQRLIDEGKAERYESKDFNENLREDLEDDLQILRRIKQLWESVDRDPKLEKLIEELEENPVLKDRKVVIFTESGETAKYISQKLEEKLDRKVICYTGDSKESMKEKVIENFDARVKNPKDDYMILVATEVLSEGVNLHRSNVVVNYDIPWNPTRLMQRVGRVNRVGTGFNEIYTFNFFPTAQAEGEIQLEKIARAKVNAFLIMLGGDAAILTEGEPVGSHELFDRLLSKKTITGEEEKEESELKYFKIIKDARENNPDLFEKIKRLPRKVRTAKKDKRNTDSLLTYFRMGKLQKFFLVGKSGKSEEIDFLTAAKLFECSSEEKREKLPEDYFYFLDKNKKAFKEVSDEETVISETRRGNDSGIKLLKILRATLENSGILTEDQEEYLKQLIEQVEKGAIPGITLKKAVAELHKLGNGLLNPLKVSEILKKTIPEDFLNSHYAESRTRVSGKREVILSLYLRGTGE